MVGQDSKHRIIPPELIFQRVLNNISKRLPERDLGV